MSYSILFDTDWVLVRSPMWSEEYSYQAWIDPKIMKPFFTGVFQKCILWTADLREVIVPFLRDWWWEWSSDEYLQAWFDFENQPDRELIAKIQELRRKWVRCYVATNQEKYRLKYLRNVMNFENLFDGIFCSAEMGMKKPDVEYYKKIIDTLWVPPSDIIYYDDAHENIEVAKNLGIQSVFYTTIHDFSPSLG